MLSQNLKVTILILVVLTATSSAMAELTEEDARQIRQIVREESNTRWIIGILITGIIGIALMIYHYTRDIANKTSDVRNMKKDIEIFISEELKEMKVVSESVSKESNRVAKLSKEISEKIEGYDSLRKQVLEEQIDEYNRQFFLMRETAEMILHNPKVDEETLRERARQKAEEWKSQNPGKHVG